ncbi:response regulator transcription factor [Microbacterium gorillae]|uniref:response regulator transcription factor n=1 Tax=Microbacterium gorillae TaxID=1231063 RepID=UPI000694AE6D|nr:helix-turn-helix transcriptional regulator [Microbacterium gorillae]
MERRRGEGWAQQLIDRDRALASFTATFTAALQTGQHEAAENTVRATALAEIVMRGDQLHAALAAAPVIGGAPFAVPERPGVLLVLAVARLQSAGSVEGLTAALRTAAGTAAAARAANVDERARNLSFAALCHLYAGDSATASRVARRGAELVLDIEPTVGRADDAELVAAACDLAFALLMVEQTEPAAALWRWVRTRTVDPRDPALMQADWGLTIVGVIAGRRSWIAPSTRGVLSTSYVDDAVPAHDPWWGLVETARAWSALDDFDPDGALQITRRAVATVPAPWLLGPLGTVHALALIAAGRASAAVEWLKGLEQDLPTADDAERTWRACIRTAASAAAGVSVSDLLEAPALATDPGLRASMVGYSRLLQGDRDAAGALDETTVEPSGERHRTVDITVRAAAYARTGNETAALEALDEFASVREATGVAAWALLLPDEDIETLRALAIGARRDRLLESLPEHTPLVATTPIVELTDRERQVLRHVQQGLTNAQIANRMFISPNTVKFHVANILRRLGVASRDEAAALPFGHRSTRD